MFQRFLFTSSGVLAFIGMLGSPEQLHAQPRGVARPVVRPNFNRGMNPALQRQFTTGFAFNPGFGLPRSSGFTPGIGFTPGFGFTPNFNRGFFDPRMNRARFDRFEDRLEAQFENRFGFGSPFGFPSGFQGGFVPGFGFVPGTGTLPLFLSTPGFPLGINPFLLGLM